MNNQAAWIKERKGNPLQVDSAPSYSLGPDQVLIKTAAVAINPVDWKIQDLGIMMDNYPNILGEDAAGEIAEVGEAVTRFKKGDRVITHCKGLLTEQPQHGAFQLYIVGFETLTSPIPQSMSYEKAVALPLAISTAACGLYMKAFLNLPYPTKGAKPTNRTILVNGASSAVGYVTVQLAVASGINVIATASPRNFDMVKSLGVQEVFDYNSKSLVEELTSTLKNSGEFAGIYDAISTTETVRLFASVADNLGGGFVVCTLPTPEGLPSSVKADMCFGASIADQEPALAEAIWKDFVPAALADGRLQANLQPIVVGTGLGSIQKGLERQKQGVSAAKVVVTL